MDADRFAQGRDWSQYFESVSLVEQVLQREPAGVYGSMDFLSRDRYRRAVEELAERTGEGQMRVALREVESARRRRRRARADRAAHVGYHLIGKGRRGLEEDVACRPRLSQAITSEAAIGVNSGPDASVITPRALLART
jgi:cyclic beta-1,2-glucan synthetase